MTIKSVSQKKYTTRRRLSRTCTKLSKGKKHRGFQIQKCRTLRRNTRHVRGIRKTPLGRVAHLKHKQKQSKRQLLRSTRNLLTSQQRPCKHLRGGGTPIGQVCIKLTDVNIASSTYANAMLSLFQNLNDQLKRFQNLQLDTGSFVFKYVVHYDTTTLEEKTTPKVVVDVSMPPLPPAVLLGNGEVGYLNEHINSPYGISSMPTHRHIVIVTCRYTHQVRVYNITNKQMMCKMGKESKSSTGDYGISGDGEGEFNEPWGVVVTKDSNHVIVADSRNNRVQVLSLKVFENGNMAKLGFVQKFGDQYTMNCPCGLALSDSQTVLVAERNNNRVSEWSLTSYQHIRAIGIKEQGGGTLLNGPTDVTVLPKSGHIAITDTLNNRVSIFKSDNMPLLEIQTFKKPCAIAANDRDHLFVLNSENTELQVFNADGQLMYTRNDLGITGNGGIKGLECVMVDDGRERLTIANGNGNDVRVFYNLSNDSKAKAISDGTSDNPDVIKATLIALMTTLRQNILTDNIKGTVYYIPLTAHTDEDQAAAPTAAAATASSRADELPVGEPVQARHADGKGFVKDQWYDGKVVKVMEHGVYTILFDDGDKDTVRRYRIRRKGDEAPEAYEKGEEVDVRHGGGKNNKKKLYPARIGVVNGDGTYDIEYDDGDKEQGVTAEMVFGCCAPAKAYKQTFINVTLYDLIRKIESGIKLKKSNNIVTGLDEIIELFNLNDREDETLEREAGKGERKEKKGLETALDFAAKEGIECLVKLLQRADSADARAASASDASRKHTQQEGTGDSRGEESVPNITAPQHNQQAPPPQQQQRLRSKSSPFLKLPYIKEIESEIEAEIEAEIAEIADQPNDYEAEGRYWPEIIERILEILRMWSSNIKGSSVRELPRVVISADYDSCWELIFQLQRNISSKQIVRKYAPILSRLRKRVWDIIKNNKSYQLVTLMVGSLRQDDSFDQRMNIDKERGQKGFGGRCFIDYESFANTHGQSLLGDCEGYEKINWRFEKIFLGDYFHMMKNKNSIQFPIQCGSGSNIVDPSIYVREDDGSPYVNPLKNNFRQQILQKLDILQLQLRQVQGYRRQFIEEIVDQVTPLMENEVAVTSLSELLTRISKKYVTDFYFFENNEDVLFAMKCVETLLADGGIKNGTIKLHCERYDFHEDILQTDRGLGQLGVSQYYLAHAASGAPAAAGENFGLAKHAKFHAQHTILTPDFRKKQFVEPLTEALRKGFTGLLSRTPNINNDNID